MIKLQFRNRLIGIIISITTATAVGLTVRQQLLCDFTHFITHQSHLLQLYFADLSTLRPASSDSPQIASHSLAGSHCSHHTHTLIVLLQLLALKAQWTEHRREPDRKI